MTADERFWAKVDGREPGSCWLWTAANLRGYGLVGGRGNTAYAHRVSWEIHHGPIPAGMLVCHHCDTPACVNPAHLFLGTAMDNARDRIQKGRPGGTKRIGERHPHAKLAEADVRDIRARAAGGERVASIARAYGVDWKTVARVVDGSSWRHVV